MSNAVILEILGENGLQVISLPRQFHLPGERVKGSKTERGILLEPLEDDFEAKKLAFIRLAGSCPDLEDVPSHANLVHLGQQMN